MLSLGNVDGVPELEVLKHVVALRKRDLYTTTAHGQQASASHPTQNTVQHNARRTGTPLAARPSVRQFPSAFEIVAGSAFTVQICFGSSEQSSTYSVCVDEPGTTPFAVTHQSPYTSWPGTPVPPVAVSAVTSAEEPSPGSCAMRSAFAAPT